MLMEMKDRRGMDSAGRIFPASGKARDVLNALISEAASNLWQIEGDAKVSGLRRDEGLWEITLENGYELTAEKGEAACKIAVGTDYEWCDEREDINEKYNVFQTNTGNVDTKENPDEIGYDIPELDDEEAREENVEEFFDVPEFADVDV